MPKTFNGSIDFTSNFNVQTTRPLDNRLVVDSYSDLTNGSIEAPYQGMVVNIKGTSELWILLTSGIEASHQPKNWELVTGSGSGSGEGVEQRKYGIGSDLLNLILMISEKDLVISLHQVTLKIMLRQKILKIFLHQVIWMVMLRLRNLKTIFQRLNLRTWQRSQTWMVMSGLKMLQIS